jgi:diguanylate cyclase
MGELTAKRPTGAQLPLPGLAGIAVMALVIALAAVLGALDAAAAVAGCIGLAVIVGATGVLKRSRHAGRYSERRIMTAQLAAVFLLLAWLTHRSGEVLPAIGILYLVAMFYGVLQLDRARLVAIGAVVLVAHGTALFMLIGDGRVVDQSAAWTQFGALLLGFAWCAYAAGDVQRLRGRLEDVRRQLHDLGIDAEERARRDALTGAYHRGHLLEALEREIARSERVGKPLSVARVDLDALGAINEAHGHAAGDVALRRFATAAGGALRDVDLLGRYGGNEFLILMPDTDLAGSVIAAERVRNAVRREPVPEVEGRRSLACTLGVAEHRRGENARMFLARAEANLTLGKAAGRDRVIAEQP